MKPALKVALILSAVLTVAGVILWLNRSGVMAAQKNNAAGSVSSSPAATSARTAASRTLVTLAAMPERVRPIMEPEAGMTFGERVRAVRAICGELTGPEIELFYRYLRTPATNSPESENEHWLRNNMMDKLTGQPTRPAGLPDVLVAIYQDKNQDVVMRDYAIQHMNPAYAQARPDEKAVLRQALWQAVEETDSSIAGTALLALNNLAQNNAEFEKDKIAETALKLAGDEQCGELSRITAVQICGRTGTTQAEPLALQLAQSAGSIPLRITAIAALGDLGDRSVKAFLQQIAAGGEDRLKPAAESALKRLNKRLGT